jgi:hypothetical protein
VLQLKIKANEKGHLYTSAGLTHEQSVDGNLTKGQTTFVMSKMSKEEREELMGKAPKFMTLTNMKGMLAVGASTLVEKVGNEAVKIAKENTELGQAFTEMKDKVEEAAGKHNELVARVGGSNTVDVPSLDGVGFLASKIKALDTRVPPDFAPKPNSCVKVMNDEGELLFRVLGAPDRHGCAVAGKGGSPEMEEVRIYPPTGGLDAMPLAVVLPDPEGDADTKVILKGGVPFATVSKVGEAMDGMITYVELSFGGDKVLVGRATHEQECYVTTKQVFKDRGTDMVGYCGLKKSKMKVGGFSVGAFLHTTECGPEMDPISFMCFDFAVQSMVELPADASLKQNV